MKKIVALFSAILSMAAGTALADPPARVGRVSHISGQVEFRADKDGEWVPAQLNYPVTGHNSFATSGSSRLEIRVGSAAIRVDEDSEISLPRLDDELIRVNVRRGVANVTLRAQESRYPVEVLSPAGRLLLNGAGSYRVETSRDYDETIITAFQGSATLESDGSEFVIKEGRELVASGANTEEYSTRNARQGPFDDWVFARDARIDRSSSSRYVSPEIAGYEDLDEHGDWQDTGEYGAVWVPRVSSRDWAPYRHGRWAHVDPWGWTWIDDAPWGFAPFHYGRWVHHNGYWGWAPGVIARRPVYAPALVGFVGNPGWSVSFSFGSAPAVGWVPLGYYDIYRPGYHCSPGYVRNINITNINVRNVNVTNVNWNNPPVPAYALKKHPHAVTVVPQSAFANGKPVLSQVARLTTPVTEPVIGSSPRIAAPLRRVVADSPAGAGVPSGPSVQRGVVAPAQRLPARVQPGQTQAADPARIDAARAGAAGGSPPAANGQRRTWRGAGERIAVDGAENPLRAQSRANGALAPRPESQTVPAPQNDVTSRRLPHRDNRIEVPRGGRMIAGPGALPDQPTMHTPIQRNHAPAVPRAQRV